MKKQIHDLLYRWSPRLWFAARYHIENEYQNYAYRKDDLVPFGNTLKKAVALSPVFGALVKDRTLLEIGCDTGFFPLHAAMLGAKVAVGVDRNRRALAKAEKAKRVLGLSQVEFRRASVPDIGAGEVFDTVLFMSAIHYMFSDKCGNTLLFQTMDSLVEYLSRYASRCLVVEFVQPEDRYAGMLVADSILKSGEYSEAAMIGALRRRYPVLADLGRMQCDTRRLFLACARTEESQLGSVCRVNSER